ncbi:MAG TPA: hypothetical protein PLA44_01100 [Propionibacteriaceae bacterium]|nr:hypothetical protein [Propionibacteriaceae bacterium]
MSSFEAFQEARGAAAFNDPLAHAGQIAVEGLEPGDIAMSEDLAVGLEESVRDHLDAENAVLDESATVDDVAVDDGAAVAEQRIEEPLREEPVDEDANDDVPDAPGVSPVMPLGGLGDRGSAGAGGSGGGGW